MEVKCKNCMKFWDMPHYGDGTKGCCGQTGELLVHNREDDCDCGSFAQMPKLERLRRRIENRLKPWARSRDDMFRRSMEIVAHICQLFKKGEFKVFDAVKSSSDMKGLIFHGNYTETGISDVWTYHCPWNEEVEHFIALTTDGKFITNTFDENETFITEMYDIESEFDICNAVIDRIVENCRMKVQMSSLPRDIEINKSVEEPHITKTVCW